MRKLPARFVSEGRSNRARRGARGRFFFGNEFGTETAGLLEYTAAVFLKFSSLEACRSSQRKLVLFKQRHRQSLGQLLLGQPRRADDFVRYE